jgi:hypothetical protein
MKNVLRKCYPLTVKSAHRPISLPQLPPAEVGARRMKNEEWVLSHGARSMFYVLRNWIGTQPGVR